MNQAISFPIIGKYLKYLDGEIAKKGYSVAMNGLMKKLGIKVEIYGKTKELKKIMEEEAVLIVANHPSEAEVLLLLAEIPQRNDAYIVMNNGFTDLCPSFNKHVIAVHVAHNLVNEDQFNPKLRFYRFIHPTPEYPKEEAQIKNRESIAKAAEMIDKGGLVAIFPGAGCEDGVWKDGVGYMLKQVKKKSKTKIIMINFKGTSTWDYLRFIPLMSKILPKFRMYFSKPIEAKAFDFEDGKVITKTLAGNYNNWIETLEEKKRKYFPIKYYFLARSLIIWLTAKITS